MTRLFTINSFMGGLSPFSDRGPVGTFKSAKNCDIRHVSDKKYSITCSHKIVDFQIRSNSFVSSGGNVTIPYVFVETGEDWLYLLTKAGKIFYINYDNSGDWVLIDDLLGFNEVNGGYFYSTYLIAADFQTLYSYDSVSDHDKNTISGFPHTIGYSSVHPMTVIQGDLYIGCGDKLAMLASDLSFTDEVFAVYPGEIIYGIAEKDNYAIITTNKAVYYWDINSPRYTWRKEFGTGGFRSLVVNEDINIFDSSGKVYRGDLQTVIPKLAISGGNFARPYTSALYNNYILQGGLGGVYSYGRTVESEPISLNLDYAFDDPLKVVETMTFYNSSIYLGWFKRVGNDFSCGVNLIPLTTTHNMFAGYATGVYESLEFTPIPEPGKEQSVFSKVRVNTKPLPAGVKLKLARKVDHEANFRDCELEEADQDGNKLTEFTTTNGTEAVFLVGDIGKTIELQLTMIPYNDTVNKIYNRPEVTEIGLYVD